MSQMFFNEIEAVKIAQNMETNGLAFYEQCAARTKDPTVRDMFRKLAGDEKEHLAMFQELEEKLHAARNERAAGYTDDAEIATYIDRLLETQVFAEESDVRRLANQAKDDYEAMAVGMRAERDSIVFYQEMLDFVDSKDAKAAFGKIIETERRHLTELGEKAADCSKRMP